MIVETLLPAARVHLVTLKRDATLTEAALLLGTGTDILAVCGVGGVLVGVVTKTDIVNQIGKCRGAVCLGPASVAMTQEVMVCRSGDSLAELWERMRERALKNVPYVDQNFRPVGMVNARDLLQALLKESTDEESLMRDYVMGVGYR